MTATVRGAKAPGSGALATVPAAVPPRRPVRWRRLRAAAVGWAYVAPPLLLFGFVIVAPMLYSAWISLFAWDGVSAATYVGLANYGHALSDSLVGQVFLHSLVLIVFYSILPICIGLVLAAAIARQKVKAVGFWRTVLFLPQALSVVVVGVAWEWLLQDGGPVNRLLRAVGLGGVARPWLGDFSYALPTEGVIGTWMMSGLCMVLLMAGAQSIDQSLYDAARVDGAGALREFFAVTLPALRNTVVVCGVLTFAVSLNNFGLIWVTTKGGPGNSTQVLSTLVYTRAFVFSDLGAASALAILLAVFMMVVSYLISRRTEPA